MNWSNLQLGLCKSAFGVGMCKSRLGLDLLYLLCIRTLHYISHYLFIKLNFCVLLSFDGRLNSFQNCIEFCGFENFFSIVALRNWIEFNIIFFLSIKMRLDSNIESKSSNNPYFNIIKIFNKLSLGDICVANFIPPCEWCESR